MKKEEITMQSPNCCFYYKVIISKRLSSLLLQTQFVQVEGRSDILAKE